ncbi:hypothetical protein LGQ02_10855 [Bacillus shivajii]|uniref:hypothetical protein n=1 Tax=Bacillus shivajii TaxID=1983719 RepID=UPI001CFB5CDA|nr:hypothetical protein [Bacillus shivajii]UCZ55180.1 hypothetical protein LGQ02_10855 [Bacillus shivajii]
MMKDTQIYLFVCLFYALDFSSHVLQTFKRKKLYCAIEIKQFEQTSSPHSPHLAKRLSSFLQQEQ